MGAVRCEQHGTHVAGPSCCDHVREAVYQRLPRIPFGTYRVDVLDDGTLIAGYLLCPQCAGQFNLSVDEMISGEVWIDEARFPYVCPVCTHCYREWSGKDPSS